MATRNAVLIYDPFGEIACKLWVHNQNGTLAGEILDCFVAPNCQMQDMDFSNAIIHSACLTQIEFLRCKFVATQFKGCSLEGCVFDSCDLTNAVFAANYMGAKSNLVGVVFRNSILYKTSFSGSDRK